MRDLIKNMRDEPIPYLVALAAILGYPLFKYMGWVPPVPY